jgi:hypothetical protein
MAASSFSPTGSIRCSIPEIDNIKFGDDSPTYIGSALQNFTYRLIEADDREESRQAAKIKQYMYVIPKEHIMDDETGVHILCIKQKTCVVELEYEPSTGILLPCNPVPVFVDDFRVFVPYVMHGTLKLEIDLSYIPE